MIGALVAIGMTLAAMGVVTAGWPGSVDPRQLLERPDIVLALMALSGIIGWWAGADATRTGWRRATAVGAVTGAAWGLAGIAVAVVASYVDVVLRGAADPLGELAPAVVWWLYGLAITSVFVVGIGVPVGMIWGLATRALTRGPAHVPSRGVARWALAALAIVATAVGVSQAATTMPAAARCLDLDGERPTDGAFSPSGDRLAVISTRDPNQPGTIRLFRWPGGRLEASWTAWVDLDVVVDPTGRVYWSAWSLGEPWTDGIMTATPGSEPAWFATEPESPLWQLTWTRDALRGMTSNSHHMASIPLHGVHAGRLQLGSADDTIGSFSATPDGRTIAYGPEWFGTHVTVTTNGAATHNVPVSDDPRSMALSADGRDLIVAGWSGETRRIDIASGRADLILSGRQAWIALSPTGELAWGTDEQIGAGVACVMRLQP